MLGSDAGQAAIVLVVALTVAMTTVGGVMVSTIVNNDPILTQTSIQRYAYRALDSGVNAYQDVINANPYLAACNSTTNSGAANATAQCAGSQLPDLVRGPGTGVGNGVVPEYYKFDNPHEIIDATTNAITYLDVQIVGAAGFAGKDVYYSTVAKFTRPTVPRQRVVVQLRGHRYPVWLPVLLGYQFQQCRQLHPGLLRRQRLGHRASILQ